MIQNHGLCGSVVLTRALVSEADYARHHQRKVGSNVHGWRTLAYVFLFIKLEEERGIAYDVYFRYDDRQAGEPSRDVGPQSDMHLLGRSEMLG